jgi:hypothetical protein
MKKLLFLFTILFFVHLSVKAQIRLGSNISTIGKADYPTHIDTLGKGGLMSLPSIEMRDGIPSLRRKQGMLVYVQSNDSLYKLTTADLSNSGWVAMGFYTQEKFNEVVSSMLKGIDLTSLTTSINSNTESITSLTSSVGSNTASITSLNTNLTSANKYKYS